MNILQVAQKADDLKRAAAFYTEFLGIEPSGLFDPPGLLFFQAGGTRILFEVNAASTLLYFQVPSVRERIADLRARNVTIESEPHVIFTHQDDSLGPTGMDEWQAFFRDSEGNLVGIASHEPQQDAEGS